MMQLMQATKAHLEYNCPHSTGLVTNNHNLTRNMNKQGFVAHCRDSNILKT